MNAEQSFFVRNEIKYSGLMISREGIIPLSDKEDAIKNIAVPTTKKQVQVS